MDPRIEGILKECCQNPNALKNGLEYFKTYYSIPNFFALLAVYMTTESNPFEYRKISLLLLPFFFCNYFLIIHFAALVLKNIIRLSWNEVVPKDQQSTIVTILMPSLGDKHLFIQSAIVL